MEQILDFIKDHKKGLFVGLLVILVIAAIIFTVFLLAPPIMNGSNYGDRLDGEKKYKISTDVVDKIKTDVAKDDSVKKVTYRKEGRVLNFTIKFEDGVVLDTAKKVANQVIEGLSEKNLEYYDIQIFLDGDGDAYPIIGYHAKEAEGISWGNAGVK